MFKDLEESALIMAAVMVYDQVAQDTTDLQFESLQLHLYVLSNIVKEKRNAEAGNVSLNKTGKILTFGSCFSLMIEVVF